MPCPCSHLYSTKFSSGGGGQVPRKLSHSLNSSVHNPSLVQMMGTCQAEGENLVLLLTTASDVLREVLQGSWVAAICSSLCVLCITYQKANCLPAAAGSHQKESAWWAAASTPWQAPQMAKLLQGPSAQLGTGNLTVFQY